MVEEAPQACPAAGQNCCASATAALRNDSSHGTFSFGSLYRLGNRELTVLSTLGHSMTAKLATAFAAAGLVLSPALAAPLAKKAKPAAVAVSFDPVSTFTPANADPRLAAAFAGRGSSLSDFKFTPAAAKGRPSQIPGRYHTRTAGNT